MVEQTGIRSKIRAWRTSNGFLVDQNQPLDCAQAIDDAPFGRWRIFSTERICIVFIGPTRMPEMFAD
jgi:hypothetical protein